MVGKLHNVFSFCSGRACTRGQNNHNRKKDSAVSVSRLSHSQHLLYGRLCMCVCVRESEGVCVPPDGTEKTNLPMPAQSLTHLSSPREQTDTIIYMFFT